MPLDDIRTKIDQLDQKLLDLLSDRADLVHEVGVIKKKEGLQIYAPEREDSLLKRLAKMNHGRLPDKSILAIYREIMSAALAFIDAAVMIDNSNISLVMVFIVICPFFIGRLQHGHSPSYRLF